MTVLFRRSKHTVYTEFSGYPQNTRQVTSVSSMCLYVERIIIEAPQSKRFSGFHLEIQFFSHRYELYV